MRALFSVYHRPRPSSLVDGTRCRGAEATGLGYVSGHAGVAVALGVAAYPELSPLARLATLPCRHKVYTHINNTNPVLLERSPERAAVVAAGLQVGFDGLQLTADS